MHTCVRRMGAICFVAVVRLFCWVLSYCRQDEMQAFGGMTGCGFDLAVGSKNQTPRYRNLSQCVRLSRASLMMRTPLPPLLLDDTYVYCCTYAGEWRVRFPRQQFRDRPVRAHWMAAGAGGANNRTGIFFCNFFSSLPDFGQVAPASEEPRIPFPRVYERGEVLY